jgi:CheY-like chemotaxis protein
MKPTILLADDDKFLGLIVSNALKNRGWQVEIARDAIQAFMLALRHQPSAIVLDLRMPGGDGLDVLRRLAASRRTQRIPVVIMSGTTSAQDRRDAMELGAAAFLCKPVSPDQLDEALRQATAA